jgi:hypothetical protein
MFLQYIHWNIGRCVHTQGQFGTRHDGNARVASINEYCVDIFVLQVSNINGFHFCRLKNVITDHSKYSAEMLT